MKYKWLYAMIQFVNKISSQFYNHNADKKPVIQVFFILTIAIIGISCIFPGSASAQNIGVWSKPDWIPGLVDTSPSQYPVFLVDPSGGIHLFHSQWVGPNFSIVYSQWIVGVGWTEPVDVLLFSGQARIAGAFLDTSGYVNIIFWGGDEFAADIYIMRAPLDEARNSLAWSSPVMIGRNASSPTFAAVAHDPSGNVAVIYSGNDQGNGVYSLLSTDFGASWSPIRAVYIAGSDTLWPTELKLLMANNGLVHAVWALGDDTGNSRAVFYTSLDLKTQSWTSPKILANAIEYEADTPEIIEYDDTLMIVYHNGFPTTRWMIRSLDDGATWTSPVRLFQQVGSNGAAAMVVDSSNVLHMFFGNRVGDPEIHGLWHSKWINGAWTDPEPLVSGPQILAGDNGEEGFDPSFAQAIISRGNFLFVVWRHDPMAGPTHIWYTYTTLPAPQLPTGGPFLAPTPTSKAAIGLDQQYARPEPTKTFELPQERTEARLSNNPLIGVIPAALLICIATVLVVLRGRH